MCEIALSVIEGIEGEGTSAAASFSPQLLSTILWLTLKLCRAYRPTLYRPPTQGPAIYGLYTMGRQQEAPS